MEYAAYQFDCRLVTSALLPPFKGSTIRGVFGRALKNVVCTLDKKDCDECMLFGRCLYPHVFENRAASCQSPSARGPCFAPHPFVIRPPASGRTHFIPGDRLSFQLLLFGPVNRHIPYFIHALKEMGRIGMGRQVNGKRGRFVLESVSCNGSIFYKSDTGRLSPVRLTDLRLAALPPPHTASRADLTLELLTPLRTKKNNRLNDNLSFELLIRLALRRVSSLMNSFDDGEPDINYRRLVQLASEVKIKTACLGWKDWSRYSFRQRAGMKFGGLVGTITYADVPETFRPLLDFAQKVHVGKQTTFGLGEIMLHG